jgi:predicted site-specific integrase-resolvase
MPTPAAPGGIARPKEVAEFFGVTVATLANWRYSGSGPKYVKAGSKVLYRWADVEAYLESNLRTSTAS